ncbi:LysR family transcriptional regulator [Thalassobacillus sp. C254]|uniref:LysR family transcriptional regulator n=1 Tax=Thalassobacillus sp. C254 TaxID=1225341 RepID=UPI0006D1AF40|nr:LysR family transcriptional regulator [Thalassobacillus sp. C254]
MNEKWLSTFVVLADQESFSKAADTLHISQSAVTKHLKALEQKLGVSLIDRDHFTLTEEGKWVYEKASEWLTEWEDLKERCSQRGESWKKTFRIGASTTPGTYFLPKLCSVFIKAYPDIRLSLQVDDSETISSSLKKGDLDMALTGASILILNLWWSLLSKTGLQLLDLLLLIKKDNFNGGTAASSFY